MKKEDTIAADAILKRESVKETCKKSQLKGVFDHNIPQPAAKSKTAKNEADVIKDTDPNESVENPSPQSASVYMLTELMRNIKPYDPDLPNASRVRFWHLPPSGRQFCDASVFYVSVPHGAGLGGDWVSPPKKSSEAD